MKNGNLIYDIMDIVANGYDRLKKEIVTDFELLKQYKNGSSQRTDAGFALEMEVLIVLERLGFPMDMQGTIFFKDMIVKIIGCLNAIVGPEDLALCDELCTELASKTSTFYHELARNDLDVGIKSFHEAVSMAYDAVDVNVGDALLIEDIASRMSADGSYPECAFVIGSYVNNNLNRANRDSEIVAKSSGVTRG